MSKRGVEYIQIGKHSRHLVLLGEAHAGFALPRTGAHLGEFVELVALNNLKMSVAPGPALQGLILMFS